MLALLIYLAAGIALAWICTNDRWWQRCLMVVIWPALIAWGMFVEVQEWWAERGYQYEEVDDERDPPVG
jgi:hypothetical protein